MYLVIIESPFKPSEDDVRRYAGRYSRAELLRQNLIYGRLALENSLGRGEAPITSHLLYTQVWSEKPALRDAGIKAGIEWYSRADAAVFYVDLGRSEGMRRAEERAELFNIEKSHRLILDTTSGKEPREILAEKELGSFAELEELLAQERGSVGRIKVGK